jgi:hypothetical protein
MQLLFLILTQFKIIFKFKPEDVASMYDDILIAKLNPGQVKLETEIKKNVLS